MPRTRQRTHRTTRIRLPPSESAGWFPFALGLLVVGCFAARSDLPRTPKPRSISFQLDGDSELYPYAKTAAEYWTSKTGIPITVTPDGDIPIVLVDQLSPEGVTRAELLSCSFIGETPKEGWIEVSSHLDPALRHPSLLHQMGHHLRGSLDHVPTKDALMSAPGSKNLATITPADVSFVCSGRIECTNLPV